MTDSPTTEREELKPCRFCSAKPPSDVYVEKTLRLHHVYCDNCGARGPCRGEEADAISDWNAPDPGERRPDTGMVEALEPFARLGGPNDGIMPAYYDLHDDHVLYQNSGQCITAGDVRAARTALKWLHAPTHRRGTGK